MKYFKELEKWRKSHVVYETSVSIVLLINIMFVVGFSALVGLSILKWCSKAVWDYDYDEINVLGSLATSAVGLGILLIINLGHTTSEQDIQLMTQGYIMKESTPYKDQFGLCYTRLSDSYINVDCSVFKKISKEI